MHHGLVTPSAGASFVLPPSSDPLSVTCVHWEIHADPIRLEVVYDAGGKAGVCPGPCRAIILPCAALDAVLVDELWDGATHTYQPTEDMLLADYLREAFHWGGFPGFRALRASAGLAQEELAFLTIVSQL